ncbi:WhiB family transcriptional regulator [Oerskovia enterophila]|uniref:Transcriptional regulator WhiB n=1 Tax=Oerskovia enterophila TaxID=43678 RepID=A0ABX2Y9Z6_9CELL|nr:WhiB family transcriptional regulator [Oerskovia enterophila]OCI32856.1 transcriptional regulator WhiB7 [Oerskovia enterophila]
MARRSMDQDAFLEAVRDVQRSSSNPDMFRLPCQESAPAMWFPMDAQTEREAKALCVPCPVRDACLTEALRRREPAGVWGGCSLEDGRIVRSRTYREGPTRAELKEARAAADAAAAAAVDTLPAVPAVTSADLELASSTTPTRTGSALASTAPTMLDALVTIVSAS